MRCTPAQRRPRAAGRLKRGAAAQAAEGFQRAGSSEFFKGDDIKGPRNDEFGRVRRVPGCCATCRCEQAGVVVVICIL
jgi:hypothetical protein